MGKNPNRYNPLNIRSRKWFPFRDMENNKQTRKSNIATILGFWLSLFGLIVGVISLTIAILEFNSNIEIKEGINENERLGLTATWKAYETILSNTPISTDVSHFYTQTAIFIEGIMLEETLSVLDTESSELAMTRTAIGSSTTPTHTASVTPSQTATIQIQTEPLISATLKPTKKPIQPPSNNSTPTPIPVPSGPTPIPPPG